MKNTKRSLMTSVISLLLCFSMLLGTTYAWFTDSASSAGNIIQSGNLDVEMYWSEVYTTVPDEWKLNTGEPIFTHDNWEPGYTDVKYVKIRNNGNLSFMWQLSIEAEGTMTDLADVIDVYYVNPVSGELTTLAGKTSAGVLSNVVKEHKYTNGVLLPKDEISTEYPVYETVIAIALHMDNNAGNKYQDSSIGNGFSVSLMATQFNYETDAFGKDYDKDSQWPNNVIAGRMSVSKSVNVVDGKVSEAVSMSTKDGSNNETSVYVPEGVEVEDGKDKLTLTITTKDKSEANIVLDETEAVLPLDVHIDGVADDNDVVIKIKREKLLPTGLNMGNHHLYHVENGRTVEMTLLADGATPVHNNYEYDPVTGDVVFYLATFSEVAIVADTTKAWEGNRDYSWYDADATELTIANADQLAAFGALVGGMAKDENGDFLITYMDGDGDEHHNDSFEDKTVKLVSDINLGDMESENNPDLIFYPIGYWNSEGTYEKTGTAISSGFYAFEGTFDGNGNTISNFYQNTWEMKGDHDWYDATLQYFRDGMGLFGKVYGGTVKNLNVENFSSDGEIATTGVIAAYADSKSGKPATFENIAITNCNPRVYNIGNGGIVGCAGWYSRNEDLYIDGYDNAVTFRNITVDQTNKISALWGSWGVSCAGILGQYYPNSNCGIKLENCHVAAIIDVNNDVCSNYQYYWYRYAGMFIGTIRANTTDSNGYTVADTTGVTAKDCTYTMGTWNEYWYCELVKNSLASYTHDHQFSRLDKISSLSEIQDGNGNWTKEGNFVIPNSDNTAAECYHIFKNSNGELYRHFHDVADESNPNIYETFDLNGDGELNDLKEDRKCYFIPFNQLLTGLDMGIKAHTEFEGITFVENGTVDSVEKFASMGVTSISNDSTISIGELFKASGKGNISSPTVQVYVSPVGDSSTASATYVGNSADWYKGTLTFSGEGAARVVITDFFYCEKTVITVTVGESEVKVDKFVANNNFKAVAGSQVTLGDIFTAKDGAYIDSTKVSATISGVECEYIPNTEDWTQGTIVFKETGNASFVISESNICNECTNTVSVIETDSFDTIFENTDKYLYRVGNLNSITLSWLFEQLDTANINSEVTVTVDKLIDSSTLMMKTFGNDSWLSEKIDFDDTFTGPVAVTVDALGANAYTFNLEVVTAENVIQATNATANNVVLLNDCGFSSLEVSGGYTLYGNGFTLTCSSDSYAKDRTYSFVELKGGTLDNVQIVVPNFSHAVMYEKNKSENSNPSNTDSSGTVRYYNIRSAVLVSATSKITNSYISGGRAAIYLTSGELEIVNSTILGGAVANIQTEASSHLILDDVTLIQKPIAANVNDTSKTVMGFSVVMMCDASGVGSPVTLTGYLHQYAWAHKGYTQYVPSDGQSAVSKVLSETEFIHSITYSDGVTADSVNLGFVYMPNGTIATNADNMSDERSESEKAKYLYDTVKVNNVATIYTYKNTNGTDVAVKTEPTYKSTTQGIVIPNVQYSDVNANRIYTTTYDDTKALWKSTLKVDVDVGAYTFSFANLLAQKYGKNLSYTITDADGNVVDPNTTIALNSAISNVYYLTITDNLIYDKNGNLTGETAKVTYVFELLSTKTSLPAPTWMSTTLNGTPYIVVTTKNSDWNCAVPVLDGLKVKYWSKKQSKEIELDLYTAVTAAGLSAGLQNGSNNTITITVADEYTLTITTTGFKTNDNGKPVVVNNKLYFTVSSSSNYVSTSTTSRAPSISYTFTDANNSASLTLSTSFTVTYSDYKSNQYDYNSFCNGSLKAASSSCITEDTFITMADGTQKRVEDLNIGDMVLAFNHETGKFVPTPVIFNTHVNDMETREYDVLHLEFSNGEELKIVESHGLFDMTLMKYVYVDYDNYADFIGHKFFYAGADGTSNEHITLENAYVEKEITRVFCPVTYFNMNSIANGFLNAPNSPYGIAGPVNYFEYDPDLKYNEEKMQADIEKYGLYTYDDFKDYISEEAYNSSTAIYLKIAEAKGLITFEEILIVIEYLLEGSLIA